MLGKRGLGTFATFKAERWAGRSAGFRDGAFLQAASLIRTASSASGPTGPALSRRTDRRRAWAFRETIMRLPQFPDHVDLIETADDDHPFRLATSPARILPQLELHRDAGLEEREGRPELMIHPDDAAALGLSAGDRVEIGNTRGEVVLHARLFEGVKRGVVIAEGVWPNSAHERGEGINVLTGADAAAPYGGAAFHDNKVWLRAPRS